MKYSEKPAWVEFYERDDTCWMECSRCNLPPQDLGDVHISTAIKTAWEKHGRCEEHRKIHGEE